MAYRWFCTACASVVFLLSGAAPLAASHQDTSYDGCDIERDCPRPFDAATPQRIRKQIIDSGLSCTKPRVIGGDRSGGKFLQCQIGDQPITIYSWPKPDGLKRWFFGDYAKLLVPHMNKVTWRGCGAIELWTPRYMVWIPALSADLKHDSPVVLGLRQALGIPKFGNKEGSNNWYVGYLTPRIAGSREVCLGH